MSWPAVFWFLARHRRRWPTRVESLTLRHADAGWVRAERLLDPSAPATLQLAWRRGAAEVRTGNVGALTVTPAAGPPELLRGRVRVTVDGVDAGELSPGETVTVDLAPAPGPYAKRRGLCGPIGELFREPFQVLAPERGAQREVAERFCADWDAWLAGPDQAAPVLRPEPWGAARSDRHLVVFGGPDESPLARRFANWPAELAVRPLRDGIVVRGQRFEGRRIGYWALHPVPWQPDRLMLLCRGYQHSGIDPDAWGPNAVGKDLEKLPWQWPDVVVWDHDRPLRDTVQPPLKHLPDAWLLGLTLDSSWR